MIGFKRRRKIPLIVPDPTLKWQAKAVFNPGALYLDNTYHILFRAMSEDNTSVIGYAKSKDGVHIDEMLDHPIYEPREKFEVKGLERMNSGCEDPRLTLIDDRIYMCYTVYNAIDFPHGAMTSIHVDDFLNQKWYWSKAHLTTKDGVDDKDTALHPEKVNGKYMLYHRVGNMIVADFGETPEFIERNSFSNIPLLRTREGSWDSKKVGICAPPIKTKFGWVLFYHGVSMDLTYSIGAALLDLDDPTIVHSRTKSPLFTPVEPFEKEGQTENVVFPCGIVLVDGTLMMYYGAADSVVNVASMDMNELLEILHFKDTSFL